MHICNQMHLYACIDRAVLAVEKGLSNLVQVLLNGTEAVLVTGTQIDNSATASPVSATQILGNSLFHVLYAIYHILHMY